MFGVVVPIYWITSPSCNASVRPMFSPTEVSFTFYYYMAYFDNDLKELFEMHQKKFIEKERFVRE
jgi:hypothetical protein